MCAAANIITVTTEVGFIVSDDIAPHECDYWAFEGTVFLARLSSSQRLMSPLLLLLAAGERGFGAAGLGGAKAAASRRAITAAGPALPLRSTGVMATISTGADTVCELLPPSRISVFHWVPLRVWRSQNQGLE